MADDIAFDKTFDMAPGQVEEVAPGVRRLLCDNPSPFTFKGTVSYIVGRGEVAIIDPGPDDPRHIAALLDAVRNESVTHVFVTHTHVDHSPGAARVKAATGAHTFAEGPHRAARPIHIGEAKRLEASADSDFAPDHPLSDGEVVACKGFAVEAIATPGHTANHMAFALKGTDLLFSGDHVMAWNTSIIAPPDGAMSDYMHSLDKLLHRSERVYLPGHGGVVRDAPNFVRQYIAHRHAREAAILVKLHDGEAGIPELVRAIYDGLDPRLEGAAGLSVLAHLEGLVARGVVATDGPPALASVYRLR
jgi:glyoxylase-like metal-dependent hydrolase (beta-lactamase superfamily II)